MLYAKTRMTLRILRLLCSVALLVQLSFLSLCVKGDENNITPFTPQRRLAGSVDAVNEILSELEIELPFGDSFGPVTGSVYVLPQGNLSCNSFSISDLQIIGRKQDGATNPEIFVAEASLEGLQFECSLPIRLTDQELGRTCQEGMLTVSSTSSTAISTYLNFYSENFDLYAPSYAEANVGKTCDDLVTVALDYSTSNLFYPVDLVVTSTCISADGIISFLIGLVDEEISSGLIVPQVCGLVENVTDSIATILTENALVDIINSREIVTDTIEALAIEAEQTTQLHSGLNFYNQTEFDMILTDVVGKLAETPLIRKIEEELALIKEDERIIELLTALENLLNVSLPSFFEVATQLADELGFFGNSSFGFDLPHGPNVSLLVEEILELLDNVTVIELLDLLPSTSNLSTSLPLNETLLNVITNFADGLSNITVGDILSSVSENSTIYQILSTLDASSTITDLFTDIFVLLDGIGSMDGLNSTVPSIRGNSSSALDFLLPLIEELLGVDIPDSVTSINALFSEIMNALGPIGFPLPGIGSMHVNITSFRILTNNETFNVSNVGPIGVSSLLLPGIRVSDITFELGLGFSLNVSGISSAIIEDQLLLSVSVDAIAEAALLFAFAYEPISGFEFGLLESFEELLPVTLGLAGCALSSSYFMLSATYITAFVEVVLTGGDDSLAGFFFTLINIMIDLCKPIVPALLENAVKSILPPPTLTPLGEGTCTSDIIYDDNNDNETNGPSLVALVGAVIASVLAASMAFILIWRKVKVRDEAIIEAKTPSI